MEYDFYAQPILNSPYDYPAKHWEPSTEEQQHDVTAMANEIPDYSAMDFKELLAACPLDEEYLVRPRDFPRDIDFGYDPCR